MAPSTEQDYALFDMLSVILQQQIYAYYFTKISHILFLTFFIIEGPLKFLVYNNILRSKLTLWGC